MVARVSAVLVVLGTCAWSIGVVARAENAGAAAEPFKAVAPLETIQKEAGTRTAEIRKLVDDAGARGRARKIEHLAGLVAEIAHTATYRDDADAASAAKLRDAALEMVKVVTARQIDEAKLKELCAAIESAQIAPGSGPAAEGEYTPAAEILSLMEGQDLQYKAIKKLTSSPTAEVAHHAEVLAELANVNAYHDGARKHKDYLEWAQQLRATSLELAEAAKADPIDSGKVTQLFEKIDATCNACHDKHQ